MTDPIRPHDFIFVELAAIPGLADGKPFEALAPGSYTDMYGTRVKFDAKDFATYVENTRAAIQSSKTESGEVVGLPVDKTNHDHEGGAGWITEVNLSGEKVLLTPKWTNSGADLIRSGERRFFSASVDPENKVILGGTLCNWPAMRTKGKFNLKPIEMTSPLLFVDESLDARSSRVRREFMEECGARDSMNTPWVNEVFDSYLIAQCSDGLYRVEFTDDGTEIKFTPPEQWKKVKIDYVEAIMAGIREAIKKVFPGSTPDQPTPTEGVTMPVTNLIKPATAPEVDLAALAADPAKMNEFLEAETNRRLATALEKSQRQAHVAEFAQKIAGGSKDTPFGLPVTRDEVIELMNAVPVEAQAKLEAMLTKVVQTGLLHFGEAGHDRTLQPVSGAKKLDTPIANLLTEFLAGDPKRTTAEFFKINANVLGPIEDYNLAEFTQAAAPAPATGKDK